MRRGQVTLYIILGLLLILLLVGVYQYQPAFTESTDITPEQYIAQCIADIAEDGIYLMAAQGGYIHPAGAPEYNEPGDGQPEKEHYFYENSILPYAINGETVFLRPIEDTQAVLAKSIEQNSQDCYDLSVFEQEGFTYEPDLTQPTVDVTIGLDDITVRADKDVTLFGEGRDIQVQSVLAKVQLRYGLLHSIANKFALNTRHSERFVLSAHCKEYTPDNYVNIYKTTNQFEQDYALRIVDASPIDQGRSPLVFQIGIKNREVVGQCVG